jgi:RNA polymerase sigma factor (TIGR02999 family)
MLPFFTFRQTSKTMSGPGNDITQTLLALVGGKAEAKDLFEQLYPELHTMAQRYMRHEYNAETLEATGLVHEAYMKLVDQNRVDWQGRTHFLAVSAQAMRRILVDNARKKGRNKRGGDVQKISLDDAWMAMSPEKEEHVLAIEEAIEKLEMLDPQQAEIVVLRFFGGLTMQDIADQYGWGKRKVESEWTMIKAWLRKELEGYAAQ